MIDGINKFEAYFQKTVIPLRIAFTTKSGWPIVISLWYQFKNGNILCATQNSALIVAYLRANNKCAFEIATDKPPYCGVRGKAIARIDDEIGGEVLEQLLLRYLGGIESKLAKNLLAKRDSEVAIILEPVKIFNWDFSKRMEEIAPKMIEKMAKACP
jgi:hypothetical protein